jgi:hypothetical protein
MLKCQCFYVRRCSSPADAQDLRLIDPPDFGPAVPARAGSKSWARCVKTTASPVCPCLGQVARGCRSMLVGPCSWAGARRSVLAGAVSSAKARKPRLDDPDSWAGARRSVLVGPVSSARAHKPRLVDPDSWAGARRTELVGPGSHAQARRPVLLGPSQAVRARWPVLARRCSLARARRHVAQAESADHGAVAKVSISRSSANGVYWSLVG